MPTKINDTNGTEAVAASPANHGVEARSVSGSDRNHSEIPSRYGSQVYDQLLWRFSKPLEQAQGVGYLLGLAGCDSATDTSLLATNLAIRAADQGIAPVLLVDANRRSPHLHEHLSISKNIGLADVLAGRQSLQDCVQPTPTTGLQLLPIGSDDLRDFNSVILQQFVGLTSGFREDFSLVIINLPAAGEMHHVQPLAPELDAALVVVRSERVDRRTAQTATHNLKESGFPIVGAVVTDQRKYLPAWAKRWLA